MSIRPLIAVSVGFMILGAVAGHGADGNSTQGGRPAILRAWGWQIAHDQELNGIDLSDAELAVFLGGAARELRGDATPPHAPGVFAEVETLAAARRARLIRAERLRNESAATQFFSALDRRPNVVRRASGLRYEITGAGVGPQPQPQQTAVVRYVGRRLDGSPFIEMDRHEIILVPNRVSPALYEGLLQLTAGAKARFYAPPALSAGQESRLGIAPGSAVIYDVELLEIRPTPRDALADALLPPAPDPPPPPPTGASPAELMSSWGWMVAQKTGAAGFHLSAPEIVELTGGLTDGIRERPPPSTPASLVTAFVVAERARQRDAIKQQRLGAMTAFFATLKRNPAVIESKSGLRYQILAPGRGARPRPGQVVVVDYVGRLLDGTVFDRTDNEPLHIQVGSVIEGFNEGVQKISLGGRIKLFVPPSLGYGDEDMSGVIGKIPAYSTLVYEIHLLTINDREPGDGDSSRDEHEPAGPR